MANSRLWAVVLGSLIASTAVVRAVDPPPQEGVEVLARGPVHEAYAEPVAPRPGATPLVPKEPPALIEELPADQKPEGDSQWMPGYWAWDEDRENFVWVSGFWRVPPPERHWLPGHWNQVQGGWQWVPGFWNLREQQQITYLPPPPEPLDAGPSVPALNQDQVYVPGNWVYRETRYLWRPGYWCGYRPGWVWVPAHYVWAPCGYVFVEGYWDYPLRDRGLLFAPVAIDLRVCSRPSWYYQPCYVVRDECLLGALFVRPHCGHYYFGDYYEPRYSSLGFTAFIDFRIGRHGCDPLFGYYRWQNRGDRLWETGLRDLYVGRSRGTVARPPRTLIQQNTLVQNITNINNTTVNNITIDNSRNVNRTNINQVAMLSPLSKVEPGVARLKQVNQEQRLQEHQAARELQAAGQERNKLEAQVLAKGPPPSKLTDPPQSVKVDLPRRREVARETSAKRVAPPPPITLETKPPVSVPADTKTRAVPTKPEGRQPATEGKGPASVVKPQNSAPPQPLQNPEKKPLPGRPPRNSVPSAPSPALTPAQPAPKAEIKSQPPAPLPPEKPAPKADIKSQPPAPPPPVAPPVKPQPVPRVEPDSQPVKPKTRSLVPPSRPESRPAITPAAPAPQPAPPPREIKRQPPAPQPAPPRPEARPAPPPPQAQVRPQPAPPRNEVRARPAPPAPRPPMPSKAPPAPARPEKGKNRR